MAGTRRATVYLDPEIHRAVRLKAAATDQSVSELVNSALKLSLAEDAVDLDAYRRRRGENSMVFEEVVGSLKRRGKL